MKPRAIESCEEIAEAEHDGTSLRTLELSEKTQYETEFMKRIEACKSWDSVAVVTDESNRDSPSAMNAGHSSRETPVDVRKPVKKKLQTNVPPPVVPRRIGRASYGDGSSLPQPSKPTQTKVASSNEESIQTVTVHRNNMPTESSLGAHSRIPKTTRIVQNLGSDFGPPLPNHYGELGRHDVHQQLVSIFPYTQDPIRNAIPDWCPPGFAYPRHGAVGHGTKGPGPLVHDKPPRTLIPIPMAECLRESRFPPTDNHLTWDQTEMHGKSVSLPPLRRKPRIVDKERHNSDEEGLPRRPQRHAGKPLLRMEVKLGSLGLDKESEEYQARLEKVRKQRSYAAQVRAKALAASQDKHQHQEHHNRHRHQRTSMLSSDDNRSRPESASSYASRSTCRSALSKSHFKHPMMVGNHPGSKETSGAAAKRAKMKEYAAQIKRPTSFLAPLTNPRINNANSKHKNNTLQTTHPHQHLTSHISHDSDSLKLSEMEKEHEKGMEDVRRIRKELGL